MLSLTGLLIAADLTRRGELKLKLGGLELTAAAASCGLTVTNGAEKVKAGRGTAVVSTVDVLINPFELVADIFIEGWDETAVVTVGGGGSKLKLGKLDNPIGMGTAWRSDVIGSSSASSRIRAVSRADSRSGAVFRDRILPPA